MPKKPTLIEPIDTSFEELTKITVMKNNKVADLKPVDRKALRDKAMGIVPINGQLPLILFHSEIHIENQGIEMGVLESGIPYLSQRGLVKMAGIGRTSFQGLSSNWQEEKYSSEIGKGINNILQQSGYNEDELFTRVEFGGKLIYAYTELVCNAVLEYYAFEAKRRVQKAIESYRALSRAGFRLFIYQSVGYHPEQNKIDSWKHFHDRIDLVYDNVPSGYFCIFKEISGMIVTLIRKGVIISDKVIPDISVGLTWAKYWKDNNLAGTYGAITDYKHNYPDYYPQSKSNPQIAKAYPNDSWGVFQEWFQHEYIETKFPHYLLNSAKRGNIQIEYARKAIEAFKPKQIK